MQKMKREKFAGIVSSAYTFPGGEQAKNCFYEASLNADFPSIISARRAINKIDTEEKLNTLREPALVMVGDRSGKVMVHVNRRLAEKLGTELKIFRGAIDFSNLTAQKEFDSAVLQFL